MRKTVEILRLKHEVGLTNRQIARSCGLTHPTVSNYLERARKAGLTWPLPEELDEDQLQALLFPPSDEDGGSSRPQPDMEYVHKELRKSFTTLQLLWEEYRSDHPTGYGYTQFCEHYKRWKAPLEVTMRQRHVAGEKTFLDWAGKTLGWTDPGTGEVHPAYLFVAALGASNYTFAEAFADQRLASWIEAHVHAVEFFGGVSRLWCQTIPRRVWTKPVSTSRRSTTATRRLPTTMASPSCRRARESHGTNQKSSMPYFMPSVASWRDCAIRHSSAWPSSTPPSENV